MQLSNRVLTVAGAAVLTAGLWAQQHQHHPAGTASSGMAAKCQQMMANQQKMEAGMKKMDADLDRKVATMNAASGTAKIDAMAAVIDEMAAQRKQMDQDMMAMHKQMMSHMADHMAASGMAGMSDCPMMKGNAAK